MTTTSNSLQTPETTTQKEEAPKPGYKETKLGWIPEDWEIKELDEISTKKGEYGIGAPAVDYKEELPTYLRITDFDEEGNFFPKEKKSVNTEEASKFILEDGDFVFARTGNSVGKAYLHDRSKNGDLVFAGFLIRFRFNTEKVIPKYIKYFTQSKNYWKWVKTNSTRSGQPGINSKEFRKLKIPLPPLPEQRQIAEILSTWDRAIEKTERLIAAKEKRKKGLIQQLLTGKVRFEDFEEEWQEFKLGDLFMERKEKGFLSLPLLAVHNEMGIIYRNELDRRDTSSEDKSSYKRVAPGDISYNSMRLWQGVIGVSDKEGIVSPAYTVVTPSEEIDPLFMAYLFKLPEIVHRFWRFSQGLVSDTLNCKFPSFRQVKVTIPTEQSEQQKIASVLNACDREIEQLDDKLDKLKEQKRGLMQELLNGKIRV
jgi:type I restriction enzyme S subunit